MAWATLLASAGWAPSPAPTWHWLLLLAVFAAAATAIGSLRDPLNKDADDSDDDVEADPGYWDSSNDDPDFPGIPRYVPKIVEDDTEDSSTANDAAAGGDSEVSVPASRN